MNTRFADEVAAIFLCGPGGTCFCTSGALVVKEANKWDVRKHVPPR